MYIFGRQRKSINSNLRPPCWPMTIFGIIRTEAPFKAQPERSYPFFNFLDAGAIY